MKRLIKIKESGKFYMCCGENIRITDVKEIDGCFKLIYETPESKNKVKVLKDDEVDEFISDLLPVDSKELSIINFELKNTSEIFNELSQGLLDDFHKLKANRDYIGQAKQRSNIVNTMINTIKLHLTINRK